MDLVLECWLFFGYIHPSKGTQSLFICIIDYFQFLTLILIFSFSDSFSLWLRFKPATVVITSELPLGSGLGSSAAFCVALSGALLSFSDSVSLDLSHKGWTSFGESELDLLNKWAFEGEKIIHGKPSGIDNTVSTYGMLFCNLCPTHYLPSSISHFFFFLFFAFLALDL